MIVFAAALLMTIAHQDGPPLSPSVVRSQSTAPTGEYNFFRAGYRDGRADVEFYQRAGELVARRTALDGTTETQWASSATCAGVLDVIESFGHLDTGRLWQPNAAREGFRRVFPEPQTILPIHALVFQVWGRGQHYNGDFVDIAAHAQSGPIEEFATYATQQLEPCWTALEP